MIGTILVIFLAIEAIGIMILEMFGSSGEQAKTFELEEAFVKLPGVKTLLAN